MAVQLLRLHIISALSVWLAFAPSGAYAQTQKASHTDTDVTSSLGSDYPGQPATAEHHELEAGQLTGKITVLRSGRPFPVGGSAFAQIKISNKAKKQRADAELVLKAQTADILSVSGGDVQVRNDGDEHVARLTKITKGKPRNVVVELKLREAAQGADAEVQNKLQVTLRAPGETGAMATVGWRVTNCAGGFYSEIVKVREGSGSGISDAIKAAQTRDSARPGRWLFPPRLKRTRATRRCVRRARRWSSRRGRYVYRCVRYRRIAPTVVANAAPVKSERSIFNFASRFVRSRALDRELDTRRDAGWATRRVSQNLKGFLQQESTPAICTGAIQFFNYFDERMAGFTKRAEKFDEMAGKAWALALLRTGEAVSAAKVQSGGHPGWGAAPLDLPQAQGDSTLKNQIENLAQVTGDAELSQSVVQAENAFAALKLMSDYYRSKTGKSLDKTTRAALYQALSAIEAADYIGAVAGKYADLRHALFGSMKTLRQAHSRSCMCDG